MLQNYLKIALRNLAKGRLYTFINLAGLSIGTAVFILLALYVHDEWTFDRFHQNSGRIYRAWTKEQAADNLFFNTVTPYILGQELRDNFPEIQQVARYLTINSQVKKGQFTEQENVHLVEPQFLKMFDFHLLKGKPEQVLEGVHSAVVTEEVGTKYFGDPYPVGRTLTMQVGGNWEDFTVTGVIEKAPGNSSIQYDILIPFENTKTFMSEGGRRSWTNVNVETYVLLNEANNPRDLEAKIAPFVDGKVAEDYPPGKYQVGLQPLTDIHLDKAFPEGIVSVSDGRYPYILSGVALLMLALACINFTTLAVGRSVVRAKEVGVRKVTGATRGQLMAQFWSEAVLTAALAVLAGAMLAQVFLPFFNTLADKHLALGFSIQNIALLLLLALVTGLLSGAYPSLVLSGFSPLKTLRGAVSKLGSDRHVVLRGLVGFQFVLSILLIISTMFMTRQLHFLQNKNLGYDKEQVVVLPYSRTGIRMTEELAEGKTVLERLRNELNGKSGITGLTFSTHTFGTPGWANVGYTEPATQQFRQFNLLGMDEQYLPLYGVQLIDGRNFSKENVADQQAVIVNETFAKAFGVAVGQPMPEPFQAYTIVGVARDFNFESLHSEVRPLVMAAEPVGIVRAASDLNFGDPPNPKISIKISGENLPATLSTLRLAWNKAAPEQSFNYSFLDDNIDRQYRAEQRLGQLIGLATGLAIFIACLGLFGIATLTIAQRTKEIGVRKVLGATTAGIVGLLSKDFMSLVILSLVIAAPVAYFFMEKWLQDFAYRIAISWWVFALAGAAAVGVAFLTVSFQCVRAALANPVKSLRSA
ncbi:MAG: ABC transporter permease [Lewinellaceae bacterium]|nr:ABC transporter permease [Lewinellaceae bacterium]